MINKNKKGVVYVILGAFTLFGILYLFFIFLDLFNIMYAQTVLQGDVRASSLHAANYIDYDLVDAKDGKQDSIILQSYHSNSYETYDTAEYNAHLVFDINFRNHYRIFEDVEDDHFNINSTFTGGKGQDLKIEVYNLQQAANGAYIPEPERIPGKFQGIMHHEPGVAVWAKLKVKPWTFWFDDYYIEAYSYSSPILTK